MDVTSNEGQEALFSRLLGDEYEALPRPLRTLHDAASGTLFRGTASVRRGGCLAAFIGFFTALPAARDNAPLTVLIDKTQTTERWHRNFAGDTMESELGEHNGYLVERLGLARFSFALCAQGGAISWTVRHVSTLGIPLPVRWFRGVSACEYARDDIYCFDVRAEMPLVGRLIEYRGELKVIDVD